MDRLGYVGEDVDQSVHRLLQASNYDVDRAQTGIICLDEFDKLAKPKAMHGGTKDISGEVAPLPLTPPFSPPSLLSLVDCFPFSTR